ncbi:amino acid ABC transporter substrate-binding protein, PAAT family [Jannaschia faecimaris]|uniref:Amino acid ABC transporter substrate-binding protein, PAAT family n=1 Tax=Jannaschia faecimaris TaxID=1244108 RepID=A0A1H3UK56_9RHOB|nr:transporter substrate-binding domain-containing protein [Jannaschia faecimaris]SDZ62215.1 amino acid ABC transporter substrate-binding protein, PAAT family [Jannaschia faecimaris]
MLKRLLKTTPIMGATFLAASFAFNDAQAQDSDREVVRVASNVNIPLRIFRAGDEIQGYEYEVYTEALERAGYEVEVTDVAFSGLFSGLQAEQWDVVASNVFITPARHAEMDHSEPYLAAFDALMVREDDNVRSLEDLEGTVVGTETGTTQAAYAEALNEEFGPFEIRAYEDIETQLLDLEVGRIDGLTLGYPTARVYIEDRGLFEVLSTNDASFMIGAFFRKGDPLRDEFNEALHSMKEDGTTAEIFEKYFGEAPGEESAVVRVFDEAYVPEE